MPNSVFLNPMERALIELDRGLLTMIDRYRHVEQRLDTAHGRPLVDMIRARLEGLEDEHESFRRRLKRHELLPHAPETDLEDIKRLATSIRAWIENDQAQALVDWLIETEQEWLQTLSEFESNELEGSQIESLRIESLNASAESAITELSEHRDRD
jgi:hypothetical protein